MPMPKAKHTLPPRIASACPNPHCTSRARVFQNVQKHMAYAQAWRQVAFDWSIINPICLLFSCNNATSTLLFTGSPIAFSPLFKMPKAKHTLPPRIASTFPNPHCTSRPRVFSKCTEAHQSKTGLYGLGTG
jgi:hypothetical protein